MSTKQSSRSTADRQGGVRLNSTSMGSNFSICCCMQICVVDQHTVPVGKGNHAHQRVLGNPFLSYNWIKLTSIASRMPVAKKCRSTVRRYCNEAARLKSAIFRIECLYRSGKATAASHHRFRAHALEVKFRHSVALFGEVNNVLRPVSLREYVDHCIPLSQSKLFQITVYRAPGDLSRRSY